MSVKEFVKIGVTLAGKILAFDEDNPGAPDSTVEVPADVWAEWIDLAGQLLEADDGDD